MLNEENFIIIPAWMRTKLNLKGNELLVCSLINGFSSQGDNNFNGSLQYMSEWTGCSKRNLIRTLQSLTKKGIIEKKETIKSGIKYCEYRVIGGDIMSSKAVTKCHGGDDKISSKYMTKCHGGDDKISHNSIADNIVNNIADNSYVEKSAKRFVPPTLNQVKDYCYERSNNVNAEKFIDYYTSNGWRVGKNKMADWKATVRTWERNDFVNTCTQSQQPTCEPDDDLPF